MKKTQFNNSTIYYPTPKNKKGLFISPKSIKLFFFFVIILALGYFIFCSSYFTISNIIYEGETSEELKSVASQLIGRNSLMLSADEVEIKLTLEFPNYKNITVYKGLPDSLKIVTEKRENALFWITNGQYYCLDETGMIFESLDNLPQDNKLNIVEDRKNLVAKIGQQVAAPEFITYINDLALKFPIKIGLKISSFSIDESTYHIYVKTEANWQAIFTMDRMIDDQLDDLAIILAKDKDSVKEYVDLRIAGRAYYK